MIGNIKFVGNDRPLRIFGLGDSRNPLFSQIAAHHSALKPKKFLKASELANNKLENVDIVLSPTTSEYLQSLAEVKEETNVVVWGLLEPESSDLLSAINSSVIDDFIGIGTSSANLSKKLLDAEKLIRDRQHRRRLKADLQKQNLELTAMAEHL